MKDITFDEHFAEICGIHAGDGWLGSCNNEVGYGTSIKEKQYFNYVFKLYSRIFNFNIFRILERPGRNNTLELRIASKGIQKIFMNVGFPRGPKIDKLKVPGFVFSKRKFIERFLRGLIDTDGSVYWRWNGNDYYISISWTSSCKTFSEQIKKMLLLLGFNPNTYSWKGKGNRKIAWKVQLQNKKDVINFIKNIGFKNNKKWEYILSRKENFIRFLKSH